VAHEQVCIINALLEVDIVLPEDICERFIQGAQLVGVLEVGSEVMECVSS
jgi:hypothetical protein